MLEVQEAILKKVETNGRAEIYTLENFLTKEECEYMMGLIDQKAKRSKVVAEENESKEKEDPSRTSSSADLGYNDMFTKIMNQRMHAILPEKVPFDASEITQGHRYEPGQFFNDHTDFFDPNQKSAYAQHTTHTGQRNWTFMVYLNDVEEGGETEFANIGKKFYPKQGMAVIWKNINEDGTGNYNTLHAGRPPVKGTKYIITKWFRTGHQTEFERRPLHQPTAQSITVNEFKIEPVDAKDAMSPAPDPSEPNTFSWHDDIPTFTEKGFKVIDIPAHVWGAIQFGYQALLKNNKIHPENYAGMENQIYDARKGPGTPVTDVLPIWDVSIKVQGGKDITLTDYIHDGLKQIHEEWSGQKLKQSAMYGIRSYKTGAYLFPHKDKIATHHISCIILVDEKNDSGEPWPLQIQAHDGTWENIVIRPGQMILYESAACEHSRVVPFKGEWFRNFFTHYELVDYKYKPKQ